MADPFIGEIRMMGFNFDPQYWAPCNGQVLPIAQNTALFSLLGTTYGGDGRTTFALPDLRARVPIAFGQSPGHADYDLGQSGDGAAIQPGQQPDPSAPGYLGVNMCICLQGIYPLRS